MRAHIVFWLSLILFCLKNCSSTNTNTNTFVQVNGYCLDHERSMLLHLKNNLKFNPTKSKKLVLWNQSDEEKDCCQWLGVTCNKEGHAIGLDLSQESISGGKLNGSSALFSLQYLQSLNLALNDFGSVIPPELHKLENLRYLNLSEAGFEGQVPDELSHLTKLVTLDLSTTSLHKLKLEKPNMMQVLLQNLTDITELYLDGVAISSAKGKEWGHALSSLEDLHVLSMSSCNLSGPIDDFSLSNLRSLSVLKLSHNNLSGSFPKSVFQIQTLKVLDISDNQYLCGSLPNFPPHGSSFHILNIRNTNFSGQLPKSISNLKHLSTIDLSYCHFNGTLPSSMSQLTQLVYLDLSSNNFTGPLPSFNMSKNLTYLSLFHNHLSGELPSSHFEGLKNLVSIDLGFNLFNGSFPSSLLKLPSLRELKLPYNQLTGLLGEYENASSSALEMLDLGNNNLQGPVPMSIFNLRNLRDIQLTSNKFNGTMQLDVIRRLSNLTTLGLQHNSLSIDVDFKDDHDLSPFPTITNLMLGSCKLRGIPSFLRNQSMLQYLDLSNNEIGGGIPNWVWQLEFLLHLNLSHNLLTNFEGSSWNLSSNLYLVDLHSNQLEGPIPFIPKYASYLDYSSNKLSSTIPLDIGNHRPFILIMSLSNNSFQGQIPESFCNATTLRLLDLSYNNLLGKIPECFATLMNSDLRVLSFGGNRLEGNISDTIPTSCSLRLLDLNDNLLGGKIPKSLVNCQKLQVLNLGKNALTDSFPCFLSNISTLRIMDLRSNKLRGPVGCPNGTGDIWEMLHIVDLASNSFSGAISGALLNSWKAMKNDEVGPEFGHLFLDIIDNYNPTSFKDLLTYLSKDHAAKLTKLVANVSRSILDQGSADSYWINLARFDDTISIVNKGHQVKLVKIQRAFAYVDMSSNYLEGPIPNELMHFKALNALNLSHNALWGHIPSTVENLKNLESLDLSINSLEGEIPLQLTSLSFLGYLNLSYNHLVGKIPMGTQIQTFDKDSFEGNEELCGLPLTKKCSNDGQNGLSPPTSETPESSVDWNFLSAELGFVFGFGIFILPLIFWKRWRLWYSKHVDEMLYRIIPQLDFVYQHHEGKRFRSLGWRY